jgi:hypothetical protein
MRYIPLRTVRIENAPDFEYAEAIRTVIRQPLDANRGVNIDEMRRGIRILDKLDAATDILELEDADYDHLKAKVEAMQWGMVDRNLLQFIDTVLGATEASSSNGLVTPAKVM